MNDNEFSGVSSNGELDLFIVLFISDAVNKVHPDWSPSAESALYSRRERAKISKVSGMDHYIHHLILLCIQEMAILFFSKWEKESVEVKLLMLIMLLPKSAEMVSMK